MAPCVKSTCTSQEALQFAKSQAVLCSPEAHDTKKKLSITNWTCFALVTLAVTLRILARSAGGTTIGLWWDDALIFVSFGLDVGCAAVQQVMQSKYGFGSEAWDLSPTQITQFARVMFKLRALAVKPLMKKQYLWVYVMLYFWAVNIVSISILVLYLRMFTKGSGQVRLRIAVYTMATITLIYIVICFIAILLICNPISRTWNIWGRRHNGVCLDYHAVSLSTAVIVPVLDAITIAIPIYPVWQMVASRWEKMLTTLLFALGFM